MFEKTVQKKQRFSIVIAPKNSWCFRGIMSTFFISTVYFMSIRFVLTGFFSVFHQSQAVIIAVTGNKRYKCLSSKIKFTKRCWISEKNKDVTCAIGWCFIILISFPLPFIYTSFIFVGSCNFAVSRNLKCVGLHRLNWYKTSQISHFIHHFKGNVILFQKHMSQVVHWITVIE